MLRLVLILTIGILSSLLGWGLLSEIDDVTKSSVTDNVMKLIENMEAPASGGNR